MTTAPPTANRREPARLSGWDRWLLFSRRSHLGRVVRAGLLTAAVALPRGRATAPRSHDQAHRAVELGVLPLALDADGIWTSGSEDTPAVSEAMVVFRREHDPQPILENAGEWTRAYDAALERIAALDLPPVARPVQRQFLAAITLSHDAVEVLHHAASQDDPRVRRALLLEAGRLRQRSEQLTQSARASAGDLGRARADVTPFPEITGLPRANPES